MKRLVIASFAVVVAALVLLVYLNLSSLGRQRQRAASEWIDAVVARMKAGEIVAGSDISFPVRVASGFRNLPDGRGFLLMVVRDGDRQVRMYYDDKLDLFAACFLHGSDYVVDEHWFFMDSERMKLFVAGKSDRAGFP